MISHKSHSGSSKNFKKALTKDLFDISESNFGMAPQRFVRNSNLDTVILLENKKAVMITSESCHYEDYDGSDRSKTQVWSAGADTVLDHPIFNGEIPVESIKKILKEEYYFSNPIESVVFIGFDGQYAVEKKKKKNEPFERSETTKEKNSDEETPVRKRSLFVMIIMTLLSIITKGRL